MNAVELARLIAAELHSSAVSRGNDPWKPLEFAIAEAKRRGIDVEPTSPNAAVLRGGRATYIAADSLIVHENSGSNFEQAFLVAHEIGPIELGDAPGSDEVETIDLARSAEPPPLGMELVIDYGRRQRREVQMDLFAREFLLPRKTIRYLHISESLSASQIAEKIGAPFEVVAQQMLDALLLPPINTSEAESRPDRPLNKLQTQAAGHIGGPYLLEAGPGTGKTQTLTSRVFKLLEDNVDPRRILVLTFSNKAAGELAERIAAKHKDAAAAMWIGTFHAFGLDLIRRFHVELGLPKDPRMLDRTEAVELLEAEYPRLGLVHYRNLYDPTQDIVDMLNAISRAKDEVVDAPHYARLAEAMKSSATTPEQVEAAEKAVEVAKVYDTYERMKRAANAVDFGDLVCLPVKLLEQNAAITAALQNTYDHVLVDEYQDVNRSSVRLLTALCDQGKNLWSVGDAKQSIYRFRGASSFNMSRFGGADFAGGTRGRLELNYRSVPEIVDSFSIFAADMKSGGRNSGLVADRPASGILPEFKSIAGFEQQDIVATTIEQMRKIGHAYRNQAVLCTGNEKLSELGRDLERLGIPVLFLGSLFERTEVKDLLALLSLFTDRRAMGILRIACWPEFSLSLTDVSAIIDYLRENDRAPLVWLEERDDIGGLSSEGWLALEKLAGALSGFQASDSPWHILCELLLNRTRVAANICTSNTVADQARGIAIWQFMNFARVQPAAGGLPIVRLLNRVRRLLRLGDDRDLRQLPDAAQGIDAVRLMTIHGAKGLEFSVVHIPGMNADTMPRSSQSSPCPLPDHMIEGAASSGLEALEASQAEEQECLFYVALSRARDRLFIYAPTQKSNGHRRSQSSFVDRLGSLVAKTSVAASRAMPPSPESEPVPLTVDGPLNFSAYQMGLYEKCPRRFFYTHVLGVGGRRTTTAFMQMHEAVRTVSKAIIDGETFAGEGNSLVHQVAIACKTHGLDGHGYSEDFQAFALSMLRYFLSSRDGHTSEPPTALRLVFGGDAVTAQPDEVLIRRDGRRILRRVQTGHKHSGDGDDVTAAAFLLAARQAFPDSTAEFVYLSDQTAEPIDLSAQKLGNRQKKLISFLGDIRHGRFQAERSSRTCPNCPAFFVCGPLPHGLLKKKF